MSTEIRQKILSAFDVERINHEYQGDVIISDLQQDLGISGHVFVVRGDLALSSELPDPYLATPKMWVYEAILASDRVQLALRENPSHKLFDGVGYSGLEALNYNARKVGREVVAVMAREHIPDQSVFERWNGLEVIHGRGPAEKGYIEMQAEVLRSRDDLLPLHQALYGAEALAPVGNRIAHMVENCHIDSTFWCIAGGSNLYGIGGKIRQHFPNASTILVETEEELTVDHKIDFGDQQQVKGWAHHALCRPSTLGKWQGEFSGVFPLHVESPNRYLLHLWSMTGNTGFDKAITVSMEDVVQTQKVLRKINTEFDWTRTTAMCMVPAIQVARTGKSVLVMAYGKDRHNQYQELTIKAWR